MLDSHKAAFDILFKIKTIAEVKWLRKWSAKYSEKFWVQTENRTHDPPKFRDDALIAELMEL